MVPVVDDGFFSKFVADVEHVIASKVPEGSVIDTRTVKRHLDIPARDRSKTAFVTRALDALACKGVICMFDHGTTKRYKKRSCSKDKEEE